MKENEKHYEYSVTNGGHCPLDIVLEKVAELKGISTLIVGMPECSYYSRMIFPMPEGNGGALHWTYTLEDSDIVFGSKPKLVRVIKEMAAEGAKKILIIVTCIPQLISDDTKSAVVDAAKETDAKLFYLPVAHFKYGGTQKDNARIEADVSSQLASLDTEFTEDKNGAE